MDTRIKTALGFKPDEPDEFVLAKWQELATKICKPCWELKYCPYGPLVEQFPLLPPLRADSIKHQEYLKRCLETDKYGDGKPLDENTRKSFQKEIESFDPEEDPESIPQEISEMECTIFGHVCPIIYAAEGFTETAEKRRTGRYIPFKVKMRVARRDNHTCQECGKNLRDDELEFDHIIPLSKGGSSEEHNIRLACFDCNRDKSDKVQI